MAVLQVRTPVVRSGPKSVCARRYGAVPLARVGGSRYAQRDGDGAINAVTLVKIVGD